MAVEAMKNILGGFQHREQCLANMCLPGFRFSFAVLTAFYQQSVVVYKGRRILFPSLQQAIFDYAAETKRLVERSVTGDEEHLFAVDFELPGTTIRRAPEGLARLNFPVSVLHRDRSLRRFESVQVDMQSMVEIPDWMAALPAASEPEDSPLDDIYACGDKGDSETITSTHVDPGAAAGTIDEKPVVGRARRVRDDRRIVPMSAMTSDRARLAAIKQLLRRSTIRCTCGNKPIHADKCNLWATQHPRTLQQPGKDVGISAADWQFYTRWTTPGASNGTQ